MIYKIAVKNFKKGVEDLEYIENKNNLKKYYLEKFSNDTSKLILEKERVGKCKESLNAPFISILIAIVAIFLGSIRNIFEIAGVNQYISILLFIISILIYIYYILYINHKFIIHSISEKVLEELIDGDIKIIEMKGGNKTMLQKVNGKLKNNKVVIFTKKYKVIISFVISISIILILPITMVHPFMEPLVYKLFRSSESASEYIQYFGAVVGGLATLIAVYITVIQTRKIQDENMKQVKIANINEKIRDLKDISDSLNAAKNNLNVIYLNYSKKETLKLEDIISIFCNLQKIEDILCKYKKNILLIQNHISLYDIEEKYYELMYKNPSETLKDTEKLFVVIKELIHDFYKKEIKILECIYNSYEEKYKLL